MIIDLHSGFPPGKSFCPVRLRGAYRIVWWAILLIASFLLGKYWHVIEDAALYSQREATAQVRLFAADGTVAPDTGQVKLSPAHRVKPPD
jgi:hypothetical protein